MKKDTKTTLFAIAFMITFGFCAFLWWQSALPTEASPSQEATTQADFGKPVMPVTAYEVAANIWYWDTGGRGEQFAEKHDSARIVHRADYANDGWFYRHIVLEADDGDRIGIIEAAIKPFADDDSLTGDRVQPRWFKQSVVLMRSP